MNDTEKRITETLAYARGAATVLEHIDLKHSNPAEAGANIEIMVAGESLAKSIEALEALQAERSRRCTGQSGGVVMLDEVLLLAAQDYPDIQVNA